MEIVNEAAQWAVLIFLGVFVVGLTRQLGHFLNSSREQKAKIEGPQLGRVAPNALIAQDERAHLRALMDARGVDWAGVVAMDERCAGCDQLVQALEADGMPQSAPLFVLARQAGAEYVERLRAVAELVVVNERRLNRSGITITPLTMIVDRSCVVQAKGIGSGFDRLLAEIPERQTDASPVLEIATSDGASATPSMNGSTT